MMLAEIRRQLDDGFAGIRQSQKRVESDIGGSLDLLAEFAEAIEQMLRRMVAIERRVGLRPAPELPRRRRPLQ